MLIPTVASPVRICLLDGKATGSVFSLFEKATAEESDCCPDCGTKDHDRCCAELKQLPDSTLPVLAIELPALMAMDLPPVVFMPSPVLVASETVFRPSVPIRGPDSPSAHRAVLATWRI